MSPVPKITALRGEHVTLAAAADAFLATARTANPTPTAPTPRPSTASSPCSAATGRSPT
ncbi:hypothetical protein [Nonomuraea sp. NPDC049646]|uniref:hypothetical protein n=1 Tax=unclassified Nonomuraea TaxID=2593643 RepID=UPI0037A5AC5D